VTKKDRGNEEFGGVVIIRDVPPELFVATGARGMRRHPRVGYQSSLPSVQEEFHACLYVSAQLRRVQALSNLHPVRADETGRGGSSFSEPKRPAANRPYSDASVKFAERTQPWNQDGTGALRKCHGESCFSL
jgi:hypothetical protein